MSKELPSSSTPSKGNQGLAIASLVLGILSLCASWRVWCGGPVSVIGLILGILGLKSSGRGMAIAGIILSAVGLLLMIALGILRLASVPFIQNIENQLLNRIVP